MKVKMRTYAPYVAALLVPVAAGLATYALIWGQSILALYLLYSNILEWGVYLLLAVADLWVFSAAIKRMHRNGLRLGALLAVSLLFVVEVFLYNNELHFLVDNVRRAQELSLPRGYASFLWEDLTYTRGIGAWRYVLSLIGMMAACACCWLLQTLAVRNRLCALYRAVTRRLPGSMPGKLLVLDLPAKTELPAGASRLLSLMQYEGALHVYQVTPLWGEYMRQICEDEWKISRMFCRESCIAFFNAHALFAGGEEVQQAVAKVLVRFLERGTSIVLLGEELHSAGAVCFSQWKAHCPVEMEWCTATDFALCERKEAP